MSNFGQSSLGNTKVGACREHEDSGRGKCFMPRLIRADRNYKGASPSEGKDEEGREGGEKWERSGREKEKKPNGKQKSWLRTLYGFNTCMSVFVNVTQRVCNTPIFNSDIQL